MDGRQVYLGRPASRAESGASECVYRGFRGFRGNSLSPNYVLVAPLRKPARRPVHRVRQ